MDTAFHLTNEFRGAGPEQLAALLCTSRYTVAWGPVFHFVDRAFAAGQSLLSPKGFIQLLEVADGPLKVMAREEWLTDPKFRHRYAYRPAQEWREDFDGEIRRLAEEDKKLPADRRRVIIARSESGWERAEERLAGPDRLRLLRRLGALYSNNQLPPGVFQRAGANKVKNKRHPAETILRDIFNHEEAIRDCGASITGLDPQYATFVEDLSKIGIQVAIPIIFPKVADKKKLDWKQVGDLLQRIQPITNEKRFLRFLRSPERQEFRRLIYLRESEPLQSVLLHRLRKADRLEPLLQAVFPVFFSGDAIPVMISAWEVLSLIASIYIQPLSGWGLLPLAARIGDASLQRVGILPLKSRPQDRDLRALYYLCFGTRHPARRHLRRLIAALSEDLKGLDRQ